MARSFLFITPLFVSVLIAFALFSVPASAASVSVNDEKGVKSSLSSIFVDDVIVESTLSVRRKAGAGGRQGRARQGGDVTVGGVDGSQVLTLKRDKRQRGYPGQGHNFGGQGQKFPGQGQYAGGFPQFQPLTGGASAAQAQAQGFQSAGPLGAFGASSAGAGSQGFSYGPQGLSGSAGLSGGQSYHLPNGQTIALTYANGFSVGPDGKPTISKGNSIAFTGPKKQPPPPPPPVEAEEEYDAGQADYQN